MVNSKAYINGVEVSLEFASMYHDVVSKLEIGVELNKEEKDFCDMINMAFEEYLKNEKN